MDLREIGWELDWIQLTQDWDRWRAVVNTVMNLRALARHRRIGRLRLWRVFRVPVQGMKFRLRRLLWFISFVESFHVSN
jgi:hypothetical protein